MAFTHRSLLKVFILTLITFGIYLIYWLVVTKKELNHAGAHIPTSWLLIIPLVNIYYLYKFAEGFAQVVFKNDNFTVPYFLILLCMPPATALVLQAHMNTK